jgi:hypothetical protein
MENNSAIDTLNFTKKSLDLLRSAPCNEKVIQSVINVTIITISACLEEYAKKRKLTDLVAIEDTPNSVKNNNSETDDQNDGYTTPLSRKSFISMKKKTILKTPDTSEKNGPIQQITEKSPERQLKNKKKKKKKISVNTVVLQDKNENSNRRDINYSVYHEIFNTLAKIANEYKDNLIYNLDDKMLFYSMREIVFTLFRVKLTDESYVEFCEKIASNKMNYLRENLAKMKTNEDLPIKVQKLFDKYLL